MATDLEARLIESLDASKPLVRFIESENKWAVIWDSEFHREMERFDSEAEARSFANELDAPAPASNVRADDEARSAIEDVLRYNAAFPHLPGELTERLRRIMRGETTRTEPEAETATPDTVYFRFVRGDAFGQEIKRLRIRKWDTKPFEGAIEYRAALASEGRE